MKRSTRIFLKEAKTLQEYSWFDWIHGYVYARWPYLYIGIGTGEHPIAKAYTRVSKFLSILPRNGKRHNQGTRGMADTYHGKVLLPESARALVTVQEDIDLRDLEKIIPYPTARDIVLKNPDHIVILECPCRSSRENPCLPLDVCMIIGEPFASFILEHHPIRSRKITQSEAAVILEEEHQRGHVHHAFFKDAMLGRFYAICNCCSCCCGAIQAVENGSPMITSSGYVVNIDQDLCIGCETCQDACHFGALELVDGLIVVDQEMCMGCGLCVEQCTEGALQLEREPRKGEPLEIINLMEMTIGSEYS